MNIILLLVWVLLMFCDCCFGMVRRIVLGCWVLILLLVCGMKILSRCGSVLIYILVVWCFGIFLVMGLNILLKVFFWFMILVGFVN